MDHVASLQNDVRNRETITSLVDLEVNEIKKRRNS